MNALLPSPKAKLRPVPHHAPYVFSHLFSSGLVTNPSRMHHMHRGGVYEVGKAQSSSSTCTFTFYQEDGASVSVQQKGLI